MMRLVAGGLLALSIAAGGITILAGEQQRQKWWQDEDMKGELGLSTQQAAEVERIFQAALPSLRAGKHQLDDLERQLSRLIRERTAEETIVAEQIDRVEAVRSELSKHRTLMLYRIHRVLTPDQNARLKTIHDRDRRSRRDRNN